MSNFIKEFLEQTKIVLGHEVSFGYYDYTFGAIKPIGDPSLLKDGYQKSISSNGCYEFFIDDLNDKCTIVRFMFKETDIHNVMISIFPQTKIGIKFNNNGINASNQQLFELFENDLFIFRDKIATHLGCNILISVATDDAIMKAYAYKLESSVKLQAHQPEAPCKYCNRNNDVGSNICWWCQTPHPC